MPRVPLDSLNSDDGWATLAASELHWFHPAHHAWLQRVEPVGCAGWSATDGSVFHLREEWQPWQDVIDASEAPFVRWFPGGLLNAAFNELDRQVLRRCGRCKRGCTCTAFITEDSSTASLVIPRSTLLAESAIVSTVLRNRLLLVAAEQAKPRIVLLLQNGIPAVVWISAAKRLGVPFTAMASGTTSSAIAERLLNINACILISSVDLMSTAETAILAHARTAGVARMCGMVALEHVSHEDGQHGQHGQDSIAAGLLSGWVDTRELLSPLRDKLGLGLADINISSLTNNTSGRRLLGGGFHPMVDDRQAVATMWRHALPPLPVDASHPLFVLYSSGSTGKPKGIVHVHGGHQEE